MLASPQRQASKHRHESPLQRAYTLLHHTGAFTHNECLRTRADSPVPPTKQPNQRPPCRQLGVPFTQIELGTNLPQPPQCPAHSHRGARTGMSCCLLCTRWSSFQQPLAKSGCLACSPAHSCPRLTSVGGDVNAGAKALGEACTIAHGPGLRAACWANPPVPAQGGSPGHGNAAWPGSCHMGGTLATTSHTRGEQVYAEQSTARPSTAQRGDEMMSAPWRHVQVPAMHSELTRSASRLHWKPHEPQSAGGRNYIAGRHEDVALYMRARAFRTAPRAPWPVTPAAASLVIGPTPVRRLSVTTKWIMPQCNQA